MVKELGIHQEHIELIEQKAEAFILAFGTKTFDDASDNELLARHDAALACVPKKEREAAYNRGIARGKSKRGV